MRLRVLAGLAALAFLSLFVAKATGVVWPSWFGLQSLELGSSALGVTAGVLLVSFFVHLRSRLENRGARSLATAASIGISGAGIGALVDFRGLLVGFGMARMTREAIVACSLGEAVAALALLGFFVAIYRKAGTPIRGTAFAIAGSSIFVALTLMVLVLHATGYGSSWLTGWLYLPVAILAPAAAVALAWLMRFFVLVAADPYHPFSA